MGNIALSSTLGGIIEFNSTKVRLIQYTGGSGTVPALNTTISQGSASGILLGVYSNLISAPITTGGSMPVSGFILIRQWNSVSYSAGVLTGITATSSGIDRPGWLEIVGVDLSTCTINRLNKFYAYGDYFDFLGVTTDGTRSTGYQIPNNGGNMWVPGVEVETDVTDVYEFYPNAGTQTALDTKIATDAIRGKFCWITTDGLVMFGHDGINSSGGYCPPSGRKIRVANLFFQNCSSASPTVNTTPHATLASRYEFATNGGGFVEMDRVSMNWYCNFNQPFAINLTNTFTFETIILTECASSIAWYNVGVGQSALISSNSLTLSYNFAGGTLDKCVWTRGVMSASAHYIIAMSYLNGFTFTNQKFQQIHGTRGNASTGCASLIYCTNCKFENNTHGGGKFLITSSNNITYKNITYYDHPATTTQTTSPCYIFEFSFSSYQTIDGVNFGGLSLCQPFSGIFSASIYSSFITCRNLGTYDEPLDLGGPRIDDVTWTRVTTTATLTSVNHGFKVGDKFFVPVSSNAAGITIALKTVLSVPTSDTITFTCVDSGATSGTLSYFPTMSNYVFSLATAANNIIVQRCYVPHTNINLFIADNSVKNVRIDNVIGDFLNPFLTAALNLSIRSVSGSPTLAAQTSVYGTHRIDAYNADVTTNLTGLSWVRSGTTCTVTCADHKLRTGLLINVVTSDNILAIKLGTYSVTVINSFTFTFTCVNSGSTSGILDIRTVVDRIILLMNEPNSTTSDQISNMDGTAAFTSTGGLVLPTIGDSVTFESPSFRYGFTGFPAAPVVMSGGIITNFRIEYKLDINNGNGYGSWHNMYYLRAGGSGVNGDSTFIITDATGVEVGNYVSGTNIGGLAKVIDITGNTITVDTPNTGTVSGNIIFYAHQRNEILSGLGFKFKIRITSIQTYATAITALSIYADSDDNSRSKLYPLDVKTVKINVQDTSNFSNIENARVIVEADIGGILPSNESVTITRSGSIATVSHVAHGMSSGQTIIIRGANEKEYNGRFIINNITTDSYEYSVSGSPSIPATGSITCTAQILSGLTDSNGEIINYEFEYLSEQPIIGRVRKASSGTKYKEGTVLGVINSNGFEGTVLLVVDE